MFFSKSKSKAARSAQLETVRVTEDGFSAGTRAFNDNTSEARIQRRNAYIVALISMFIAVIAVFGNIAASQRPSLVPYVIAVDRFGQQQGMGIPPQLDVNNTTTTIAIQYQLRQFIQAVREVVYDPNYQTKLVTDYVRPFLPSGMSEATTLVNNFYKINDPYKMVASKGQTIEVQMDVPIQQTPTTYELHWKEITKGNDGIVVDSQDWQGYATVELHAVTPDEIRLNPIGMFVKELTWQNVGAGAATAATPTPGK